MAYAKASKQSMGYKNNFANLPQEVKHETYPSCPHPLGQSGYPDDLNLMDKRTSKNASKISRSKA